MHRRAFLRAAATGLGSLSTSRAQPVFEPWRPGILDIHHLAYGRGNSTFVLGPDGTSFLIDAGTTEDSLDVSSPQKPDAGVRPGSWIANYALRQMRAAGARELDYFLLTHLHPDHAGDLGAANPPSPRGNYRLTGVMDVDAVLPIATVIDRGFPDYDYPARPQAPFALNYLEYIRSRRQRGLACERLQVGRSDQIRLLHRRDEYPGFTIRNLAASGEVWTGSGDAARRVFPALQSLQAEDYPTENMCSIAIRLGYGRFSYFTGGDLTCDTGDGAAPWRDLEAAVARACGPVDVAVANHHAYFDAVGPDFVRTLRPRVFIIPAWYVAHPSILPLRRMVGGEGSPAVFATNVMPANRSVNNQFISKVKSLEGHIVVRVLAQGSEFRVLILDNSDDSGRIKAAFGPFRTG